MYLFDYNTPSPLSLATVSLSIPIMSYSISSVCSPRVGGALCVLVGAVGILIGVLSIDTLLSMG